MGNGDGSDRRLRSLSWNNVTVDVSSAGQRKTILRQASGAARSGKVTAIMGHSGSGKTTLIHALTGRNSMASDGTVQLGHHTVDPHDAAYQKTIAFVADVETLEGTATCEEVLHFSAHLRVLPCHGAESVEMIVDQVLSDLHLQACRDTQCRFLSAGERRRLSIALELITMPELVILDEPTSGLDSYHGLTLMKCLRTLANHGTTVLLSIHHPSCKMWDLLDHVILLRQGHVILDGPTERLWDILEQQGFPLPSSPVSQENIAEWILYVSQEHEVAPLASKGNPTRALLMKGYYTTNQHGSSISLDDTPYDDYTYASPTQQFRTLMGREVVRITRNRDTMIPRYLTCLTAGICFGMAFYNAGSRNTRLSSHLGSLFLSIMATVVLAQGPMRLMIQERPLYEREYRTGHYHMWVLVVTKMISEGAVQLSLVGVYFAISFPLIGFEGRWCQAFLCHYAFATVFAVIHVLLVCIVKEPVSAIEFVGIANMPNVLFSGFYVAIEDMPKFIQWACWVTPVTWVFRLSLEEEFRYCRHPEFAETASCMEAIAFVESNYATEEYRCIYIVAIIGLLTALHILIHHFLLKHAKP